MDFEEILELIDKGKAVDWDRIARRQSIEFLASARQYAKEAEERARQADREMQEMIENAGQHPSG